MREQPGNGKDASLVCFSQAILTILMAKMMPQTSQVLTVHKLCYSKTMRKQPAG